MVTPEGKRSAAQHLQDNFKVSKRRACRVTKLPRATRRYEIKPDPFNEAISRRLVEIAEKKPRFGAPRLHVMLCREDHKINHKRTERIYRELGLSLRRKRRKNVFAAKLAASCRRQSGGINTGRWILFPINWSAEFASAECLPSHWFKDLADALTKI